jgi:hypothetical protein
LLGLYSETLFQKTNETGGRGEGRRIGGKGGGNLEDFGSRPSQARNFARLDLNRKKTDGTHLLP